MLVASGAKVLVRIEDGHLLVADVEDHAPDLLPMRVHRARRATAPALGESGKSDAMIVERRQPHDAMTGASLLHLLGVEVRRVGEVQHEACTSWTSIL